MGESNGPLTVADLKNELKFLEQAVKIEEPLVFCHNDTLLGNIVYDEVSNCAKLIDYEYGGPNYRAFDIGQSSLSAM